MTEGIRVRGHLEKKNTKNNKELTQKNDDKRDERFTHRSGVIIRQ